VNIRKKAILWQTPLVGQFPTSRRKAGQTSRSELLLIGQAKHWPTPSAHDGRHPGHEQGSTQGANLKRDAEMWATPTSHERTHAQRKVDHGIQLANQASGHPAQPTTGGTFQVDTGPRSLNPNFVEWLMGMPPGLSDFARLEMPLSLWWQRMRSELSRLR
jgi:hypothetical protein